MPSMRPSLLFRGTFLLPTERQAKMASGGPYSSVHKLGEDGEVLKWKAFECILFPLLLTPRN